MRLKLAVAPQRSLLWCKPLGGHTDPERPFFGGRRALVVVGGRKGDGKQQRKPKSKEEVRRGATGHSDSRHANGMAPVNVLPTSMAGLEACEKVRYDCLWEHNLQEWVAC